MTPNRSARNPRTKESVQEILSELVGYEHMERAGDARMSSIINRASRLDPNAWEQFRDRMSAFRPSSPISFNSLGQSQRTKLYEEIEQALTSVESGAAQDGASVEE